VSTGADSCVLADYGLELDWGASAGEIGTAFAAHVLSGGSPLDVALEGAIAEARALREPGRTVAIVIVTDASPRTDESCGADDWDLVADVARTGVPDGVHTHVLSIIAIAIPPDHFGRIGEIATGGDGFAGIVNGSRTDVERQSTSFLADVRDHMEGCSFVVPDGLAPDAVTLRRGDGTTVALARVLDRAACDGSSFYLDASGTTLTLCSGRDGVGGLCQLTYVTARTLGPPTVTTCAP
jgi:hypothetical protein